jgi:epoxyqueuosine reductase
MKQPKHESRDRTAIIRDALESDGACCVGFADVSGLELPMVREYPIGICFSIRYDDAAVNQLPDDEAWMQMSSSLAGDAEHIYCTAESLIESWGYRHRRVASGRHSDDLSDLREELPQKTLATLSGLGWIGKSSLLISSRFGPRIRIGALLTNMPLNGDSPILQSQCGDCRACVDACPVNAITGTQWSRLTSRSELLDVWRCHEYLWSTKVTLGRRQTCGVCLKLCPAGDER